MPTDLDPIAVLRRTDPAATLDVPQRPALDELAPVPESPPTTPRRSARVVAAAAVVALLAGSLAAVVAITARSDDDGPLRPAETTGSAPTVPTPDTRDGVTASTPESNDEQIREGLVVATWSLVDVAEGGEGSDASPVPDDTFVELTFDRDGTYELESACSVSTGTFAVDGGTISLAAPSRGGATCDTSPTPGDELALAFADALGDASVVAQDGERLVVTSGDVRYGLAARVMPYFDPAPGWEALPQGEGVVAATVPLGPATSAGEMPWDTVERLGEGDVVVFAMVTPAGESTVVDGAFPPRELPLSLDDAESDVSFEGQPDHVWTQRLTAQVDGWNIDVLVFYGTAQTGGTSRPTEPDAPTVAAAQEQLAHLIVPTAPGG